MKHYKNFEKKYIGFSDVAALILVGFKRNEGLVSEPLFFGGDSTYRAYIVYGDDVEIGSHYQKVAEFSSWLKIYDDGGLTFSKYAKEFRIYRAGDYGVIIQILQ